ncbi:hypothetical protein HDU84_003222, partial [Entophlyctis sp. JEL0112]
MGKAKAGGKTATPAAPRRPRRTHSESSSRSTNGMSGDSADGPFSSRDDMSDFIDWESELGVSSESIDDEIKGTDEVKVLARLHKTDEEIALLTLDESLDEVKRALHLLRYAGPGRQGFGAYPDRHGQPVQIPAVLSALPRLLKERRKETLAQVLPLCLVAALPASPARYGYSDLATQQETLPARPPDLQIMAASVLYDLVDKGQLPEAAVDDVYQCAARLLNSKSEGVDAVRKQLFHEYVELVADEEDFVREVALANIVRLSEFADD